MINGHNVSPPRASIALNPIIHSSAKPQAQAESSLLINSLKIDNIELAKLELRIKPS